MARKGGLGRGLDSLISTDYVNKKSKSTENEAESTKISTEKHKNVDKPVDKQDKTSYKDAKILKIVEIEPNRSQPRSNFDENTMEELTESIRRYGVLQPVVVKKQAEGQYMLVAGERRWRAAKAAGLKEIPAIVRNFTEQEIIEIALIENIQRENLNVIEEARTYQRLIREFSYRQEDLAEKLSRSRTAITNRLRLLKLSEDVQNMLIEGTISEGHARALLPIEDPELQLQTAMKVMDNHLSVREAERLVKNVLEPKPEKDEDWKKADQFIYEKWEEDLRISMGTKVSIKRKNKDKGNITIDYYSPEELERLLEMLKRCQV